MKHFTFQWQRTSGHLSGTASESSQSIFGKCLLPILAMVFATLTQVNPVFGQCPTVVCSSPSNLGNFGVDGDLNANEPGTLTGINDDWFESSSLSGLGIGVIGTTAATSVPAGLSADDFKAELLATSSRNLTYVQRMAFPNIHPRFITPSTGHLLLDAVAARDNHTAGNSVDSTAFASGTDKNGANPATWSLGITGVPQKNDLIDVGGHLRRAYNFGTNTPGPLLGYAFATTRNTSGDSHIDFEIFRTAPVVVGTQLTNTGPNGGHTTTKFVPGGFSLQQPGDVLVSIDYGNGGTNPCASVRVWVNPNNVDGNGMDTATYNALPVATRIYTFTGVFDGASSAAPFGYAEIRPKTGFSPSSCLFISVTNTASPLGAPWGSLSAQNASFQTNLEPLQLVEVAIDFSAFGLDIDPLSGNCFNLFGSLLIKTRSSTSFTSEMKDFAGPFIFGNFQEVNANAGQDKNLACSVTSAVLNGSSTTPGATYSWTVLSGTGGNIVSGANTATPTVNSAGTYVLTVSNPSLATCVATDTVIVVGTPDITPPTVSCPPAVTRHCTDEIPAPPANLAEFVAQGGSASDISGVINISSSDGPLTGGLCGGTITRTFTIKDQCNNATTCTQVITINDDIAPIIVSGPASQTLGCNPTIPAADISLVSATDNCSGVTVSALPDVTIGDCNRTLTRTYVATDGCGNTSNYTQTFTFKFDTVAPVIVHNTQGVVNGSTSDIGCNPTANDIASAFGSVSASDNCDASVLAPFMNSATTQNGCMRSRTRTWMGVDSCGNASVAFTRTLTWKVDTDAPVISLDGSQGSNPNLGCNPTGTQIEDALGTASVSDNCDNLSASPSTSGISSNGCFRTQTRTFNATDLCGNNAASVIRTVTWKEDLVAPVITPANADSNLGCNPTAAQIEAALGTASVNDNCDVLTATVNTGSINSNGCIRTQTRTWSVSDACGNAATQVSVTATWTEDLTPPVINANGAALALGCNPTPAQIEAALGTATASDACGSVTPTTITAPEVINGCLHSQTRSWNAMDVCGNDAIVVSRTATWKVDLTAPVITLDGTQGANPNLGCNPTAAQILAALGTASASDDCDIVTANPTTSNVSSNGCFRTQTRTWNANDLCGNNATAVVRTVTWKEDTTAPAISLDGTQGANPDLGCNPTSQQIESALGTASASDNCDNVSANPTTSGVTSNGCFRTQTRTWNASDLCGNNATAVVRTVTWKEDLTAPVITLNGTQGANPDLGCNPTAAQILAALGTASASDDCDIVTANPTTSNVISNGCFRTQTRTWNASDLCGNTATAVVRTVTWKEDTTSPAISLDGTQGANPDLGCNPTSQQIEAALGTASASDNCDNVSANPTTSGVTSNGCFRTQTRTWNASDLCGNNATAVVRTVTWKEDLVNPVISHTGGVLNGDTTDLGCNPTWPAINAGLGTVSVSDNCDASLTANVQNGSTVSAGCFRYRTRTWNATDDCGNNATTFRHTVRWTSDTIAPVITLSGTQGANPNLGCNPSAQQIEDALGTATVSDGCGNIGATRTTSTVSTNGCFSTQTRTWTVTDGCGNVATPVVRTVTWKVDLTAPVISLDGTQGSNPNLGCNPNALQIEAALGTASAADNCDNVTANPTTSNISSNGCFRTQTRTWNASDLCGNNATAVVRTVTWKEDLTAPTIALNGTQGANPNLGCNPTAAQIEDALGTASATDDCDNVTANPTTSNISSNGCFRTQTRTWNASDLCGNNATAVVRTVTWKVDVTVPVISLDGTQGANPDLGCNPTPQQIADALGSASVSDDCDNLNATANTSGVSSNGCFRTQTRTFNAVDLCSNNAVAVVRTVTWKVDITAPVITLNGPQGANPDLGCNPTPQQIEDALGSASASDDCDNVTANPTTSSISNNGCFRTQTRTWTATDLCGNNANSVTRTVTWKSDLVAPVVSCNINGDTTICAGSSINISSTANDDCDGPLSSSCSRSDGASLTDAFPVGVTTVTCSATDACGNTGNCSFTVTVLANPTCTISAPTSLPVCGSTGNLLSATASNATSYSWSVTTVNAGATPWSITSGANSPTVTYTPGSGPATFTLTVTNTLNGTNCVSQCQVTFECINSRFCTYTQGYYGASGGTACSGQTTTPFVRAMLNGNPLITGTNGNNLTVTTNDFVSPTFWFYKRMPGGGTSAVLNGSSTCQSPGTIQVRSNGTFKNILLSQTITLGLNLRVPGTGLGGLRITGKYLLTYASSGSGCTNNTAAPIPGTAQVKFIPGSVINYLGANNTVADLLNLANQALGGTLPAGAPGLSAISNAVAAFNEGFDECRFLGGFFSTNPLDTPLTGGVRMMDSSRDFNALAYPNPARDQVTIEFMLNGFDSEVALEVFDLNGRRVAVLYNEQAEGDVPYRTNLDALGLLPGVYFYQLTTGKGVLTDKFTIIK